MSKRDQTLAEAALDGLLSVGTVRGICLARGGEVLVNRFPFSDGRLLNLCAEVEQVLKNFTAHNRDVERIVLGFDGGHLVLQVDGDVRLLIMHLIPDEADFVAKAGQALLADHREAIAAMKAMAIEIEIEVKADAESQDEAKTPAEDETAVLAKESEGDEEKEPAAAAAKSVQPPERDNLPKVVSMPETAELPLETLPSAEGDDHGPGLRELLEASRQQEIDHVVLATGSDENVAECSGESSEEEGSLELWAEEHLDLPEDSELSLLPKPGANTERRSSMKKRPVVGAVRVQPVRLAAQQPQSTLPPPKKPRARRARATAKES